MNSHFSPTVMELREAQKLRPNFSKIARSLGVTPQHVRRVFNGESTSDRVMKAIESAVRQEARKGKKQRKVAA